MSTIDDLRGTLERHAGFPDPDAAARAGAVRGRVRAVRRRRAAAAVAVAALVVVGSAAVAMSGGDEQPPAPADRTLNGMEAPASLQSLGYTYRFKTGYAGSGTGAIATVDLAASDQPRLISWGAPGDDAIKVSGPGDSGGEAWTSLGDDFTDFTLVPPGVRGTWKAYADDVAMAVYDLDAGVAPPGHTGDGITFRNNVADDRLLGATIGEAGQADLQVEIPQQESPLKLTWLCSGGGLRSSYLHLSVNGEESVVGPGCEDSTFDPGGSGGMTVHDEAPFPTAVVQLSVTDGRNGPPIENPDLRLGLGVYRPTLTTVQAAGYTLSSVVEHDGHRWQLVRVVGSDPGVRRLGQRVDGPGPTLVTVGYRRAGAAPVHAVIEGGAGRGRYQTGSGTAVLGVVTGGDRRVSLTVGRGSAPRVELAIVTYQRLD